MANSDFFEDPNVQIKDEVKEEPVIEKVKVDGSEYTQDELKKLVGLGKIGLEAEEKFKTPIDKVWPNYQRVINENQEFKRQAEEAKQQEVQNKINQGQQLSNEELKEQAKKQARELGLMDDATFESRFREEFAKNQAVANLLGDTANAVEKFKNDYNIEAKIDDVLQYMDDNGFKNPDKAMKIMFEDRVDQVKEQRLKGIKPQGMTTNTASQAGGKQPEPMKLTKDNLDAALHEFVQGAGGGE